MNEKLTEGAPRTYFTKDFQKKIQTACKEKGGLFEKMSLYIREATSFEGRDEP